MAIIDREKKKKDRKGCNNLQEDDETACSVVEVAKVEVGVVDDSGDPRQRDRGHKNIKVFL